MMGGNKGSDSAVLSLSQFFPFISLKLFSHFAVEARQIRRSCSDDRFPVLQGRQFSWFVLIAVLGFTSGMK